MNVKMWIKALKVIPRLEKGEWDKLDVISKWLISVRAAVLVMTFTSPTIAGLLALREGKFDLLFWALCTIGLIFAHATNNLLNDWIDYKRGVDENNYYRTQYGPQPVAQGLFTQKQLLTYAAVSGAIAVAAGIPLVIVRGVPALILMAVGAAFVLFYTWPLKYIGLGEIVVLITWGPLMIAGGYFVITGETNWNVLWQVVLAGLSYALGSTSVIFGKHIDKSVQDKAKHIYTLPVLIGEKAGRAVVLIMFALMYLLVVFLVIVGYFSPVMLIVLVAALFLPRPVRMYLQPKPVEKPAGIEEGIWPLWFSAASFYHTRAFGLVMMVGLILNALIK
jgi:1,4-dihydroxy-2-naphthoate octaprenyltransferase